MATVPSARSPPARRSTSRLNPTPRVGAITTTMAISICMWRRLAAICYTTATGMAPSPGLPPGARSRTAPVHSVRLGWITTTMAISTCS